MKLITNQPLTYTPLSTSKVFEIDLESLRGFAALLVVWYHLILLSNVLDPAYVLNGIFLYVPPGHFCVLLFFVLSGYVIGLNTKQHLSGNSIWQYLNKRITRIYPIYFISILFSILIAGGLPWRTIIGSLALLQVGITPVISSNGPSWSLHFEVFYYLLFIPISFFRINPIIIILACISITGMTIHLIPNQTLISAYSIGFAFWCCGLALAKYMPLWGKVEKSYTLLISLIFLFISFPDLNFLDDILTKVMVQVFGKNIGYPVGTDLYKGIVTPHDFSYLPYAILGIMVFTHSRFRFRRLLLTIAYFLPLLALIALARHWSTINKTAYVLPTLCYTISLSLFLFRPNRIEFICKKVIANLTAAGSISYGIYIIHFPLIVAFQYAHFFLGTGFTFLIRTILLFSITIGAAYWLEKKFQPWIRHRLGLTSSFNYKLLKR